MNGGGWLPTLIGFFPDLTPSQAGAVTLTAFVVFVVLDAYAASDDAPGNSPREVAIIWSRESVSVLGLRFTGGGLAFLLGALVGHWFHPGLESPFVGSSTGLVLVLVGGFLCSFVTGSLLKWTTVPALARCLMAVSGALLAALIWPVSV